MRSRYSPNAEQRAASFVAPFPLLEFDVLITNPRESFSFYTILSYLSPFPMLLPTSLNTATLVMHCWETLFRAYLEKPFKTILRRIFSNHWVWSKPIGSTIMFQLSS